MVFWYNRFGSSVWIVFSTPDYHAPIPAALETESTLWIWACALVKRWVAVIISHPGEHDKDFSSYLLSKLVWLISYTSNMQHIPPAEETMSEHVCRYVLCPQSMIVHFCFVLLLCCEISWRLVSHLASAVTFRKIVWIIYTAYSVNIRMWLCVSQFL